MYIETLTKHVKYLSLNVYIMPYLFPAKFSKMYIQSKCLYIVKYMNCKRQTRLENKDTKLTIRITESEVEEIDSFLKGNPRFSSRSEFIRFAALDYVAQNRIKILGPNEISLKLDKIMEQTLAFAIREGFFNDRNDAIMEILNEARSSGLISKIIDAKNSELKAVMDRSREIQPESNTSELKTRSNQDQK